MIVDFTFKIQFRTLFNIRFNNFRKFAERGDVVPSGVCYLFTVFFVGFRCRKTELNDLRSVFRVDDGVEVLAFERSVLQNLLNDSVETEAAIAREIAQRLSRQANVQDE